VNLGTSGDSLVGASSAVAGKARLQIDGVDVAAVPVPAGEGTGSTWAVVLSGLKTPLRSGQYVDVTLTFAKAGVLENLSVPVRSGDTGLADREEAQDPYHVEE
jgi:copper(I)-binding protein